MRLLLLFLVVLVPVPPSLAQRVWPGGYPEGPVWIGETLYWADMFTNQVMRGTDLGPETFFEDPGCGPTAIAPYRDEDLIVLCHLKGAILHLTKDASVLAVIDHAEDGTPLRDPNDVHADGKGGVWFTDPGSFSRTAQASGRLYHLSADGLMTLHAVGLAYGNGVYLDAAGQRLLVSEHLARRVLSYPLQGDELGAPSVLIDLTSLPLPRPRYALAGPDGLEIGPDGTLWFAEYGAKRILGWRDEKGLVAALEVDPVFVTNIAFGPNGLVALTGTNDNRSGSRKGGIWTFEARQLERAQ